MSKESILEAYLTYVSTKANAWAEVDRVIQDKLDAFEEEIVRSKESGMSLRAITTAYGAKGRDRVYDILDRKWPGWREEEHRVGRVIVNEVKHDAKNFVFDDGWAFVDLYWPGSVNANQGYYRYRITDKPGQPTGFTDTKVNTDDAMNVLEYEDENYWLKQAYRGIVAVGKGADLEAFERKYITQGWREELGL